MATSVADGSVMDQKSGLAQSEIAGRTEDAPAFDREAARKWLNRFAGAGLIQVCSSGDFTGRTFTDAGEAVAWAAEQDQAGAHSVYARATSLLSAPGTDPDGRITARRMVLGDKRETKGRGGAEYSGHLIGFWADLDIAGPGHSDRKNYPPDEETARKIVAVSCLPEPTVWVHTGGGLQAWWLLPEPYAIPDGVIGEWRDLSKRWHAELNRAAGTLGFDVDETGDLARVMRLPGSVNRKSEMPDPAACRVLSQDGPELTAQVIARVRDRLPRAGGSEASSGSQERAQGGPVGQLSPFDLLERVVDWLDVLPDGWSHVGGSRYVRPGASSQSSSNAELGNGGLMYVHSDAAGVPQGSYTKGRMFAAVHYGGDASEAAADLLRTVTGRATGAAAGLPADVLKAFAEHFPPESGPDDDEPESRGRDGRVKVNISSKPKSRRTLLGMVGTGPLSGVYLRGHELVYTPRVGETGYIPPKSGYDGPAQVHSLSVQGLKTRLEYSLNIGRNKISTNDDGSRLKAWTESVLPSDSAAHIHEACLQGQAPNLPELRWITHTPTLRPDGSVLDSPGFDPGTGALFLPDAGVAFPQVSATPEAVQEAVALLRSIVDQFPFANERDRGNWFAALLSPALRMLYPPPYPLFVVDAPQPGTGKTLLSKIVRMVHGGSVIPGWPEDDAELRKKVTSVLYGTTAPVVVFDNIRGKIQGASAEMLLTERSWNDRLLGESRSLELVNDRLWMATANNAAIGGDMARRCLWITIDAGVAKPQDRTGFRRNLDTWVPENRPAIVGAILTVISAWIGAGRPDKPGAQDTYGQWSSAVAGLLAWSGLADDFGRADDQRRSLSDDDAEWLAFLTEARRVMGDGWWSVRQLVTRLSESEGVSGDPFARDDGGPFLVELLPGDLADRWSRSGASKAGFVRSLGKWLNNRAGRYVDGTAVKSKRNRSNTSEYQVITG